MRITVDEDARCRGIEIGIRCRQVDERVRSLVARIRMLDRKLTGRDADGTRVVPASDVLWAESVDKRTFLYTADAVLETALRLYELEELLAEADFVRVSKAAVVNFAKVVRLRPEQGGRLVVTLENNEVVLASRHYVPGIKQLLGMA